ncbi:hypothetical protein LAZ67_20002056 [Cordylochernes scorpioides]|uniref:Uncharacterized protein n=1 Tax=Cordylochernes scorpioides TaxID=51811 RepID=A0ABY6LKH4_9ARAC|nr:hypothetical protein LAZ67_20002056 [Cordylochernes scorpioides]
MSLIDKRYVYIVPSEHTVVGLLSRHTWTDNYAHVIGLKMEYPEGKKSTFSTSAFLCFSSRLKSSRSNSEHMLRVWKSSTKWFAKFKNGDLDLEDTLRIGRPSEFDEDHPKALLKEDGR